MESNEFIHYIAGTTTLKAFVSDYWKSDYETQKLIDKGLESLNFLKISANFFEEKIRTSGAWRRNYYTQMQQFLEDADAGTNNTCDILAAESVDLYLLAAHRYSCATEIPELDELLNRYRQTFLSEDEFKQALRVEELELMTLPHFDCRGCSAIIWEDPGEGLIVCDSCGHRHQFDMEEDDL